MSVTLQKLSRSFSNTLFYMWTVIQALLSLGSPVRFPLRETSTVVPYPLDVDLERGSRKKARRARGQAHNASSVPSHAPHTSARTEVFEIKQAPRELIPHGYTSYTPVPTSALLADAPIVKQRTSNPSSRPKVRRIEGLAQRQRPSRPMNHEGLRTTKALPMPPTMDQLVRTSRDPNMSCDPFLDIKPPASFTSDFATESYWPAGKKAPPLLFSFCTSTPLRSYKGGKGHRRATCTTIAFLTSTPPPPVSNKSDGSPGIHQQVTPLIPSPQAGDVYLKTLNSISVSLKSSSSSIISLLSRPLRMAKGSQNKSYTSIHVSRKSETSNAVIKAVRDAFLRTREDEDSEGKGARELIERDSVWTCARLHIGSSSSNSSNSSMASTVQIAGDHGSTPPNCSQSSSAKILSHTTLGSDVVNILLRTTNNRSTRGSIEFSDLWGSTPPCSVDSCLDDILVSFEHLMSTMPVFHQSLAKHRRVTPTSVKDEVGSTNVTGVQLDGLKEAYDGCVAQCNEVLS